jgi:ketosteroid isomerase-like protein
VIALTAQDRLDIIELQSIFAWAVDRRDADVLAQAFTEDFEATYPGGAVMRGRDAFGRFLIGFHAIHDATQHHVANHWLVPQDDSVIMRSEVVVTVRWDGCPGGDVFRGGARYVDRVVRTDAGWRIAARTAERIWQTGNPEILEAGRREALARL